MTSVSATVTINQPVEKVFTYVASVENHKAWQAGIQDATVTPAGPINVGSIYQYTSEVMGRRMETQMQVSAFETNTVWAIKTIGIPTPVETIYRFESDGNGTKLTISMEMTGGFPAAAEAMVKQQMEKTLGEQANRIKQMVGG